jgi:hypothetical protein
MKKTKIVLDADVVIHFAKGNMLNLLPEIFTNYEYIILDKVYGEIHEPIKSQLNNQVHFLKNIGVHKFSPKGEMLKEFAILCKTFGLGESASMVYCRYNNDALGSSNLKDIEQYCKDHKITYLTTFDFLYYAIKKELITVKEANEFVNEVKNKDSRLPNVDFSLYVSKVVL